MNKSPRGRPAGQPTAASNDIQACIARYEARGLLVSISRIARETNRDRSNVKRALRRAEIISLNY